VDEPFDVIVSGHLCLDLIPDMAEITPGNLAMPGRLYETGPIGISTGGAVSNTGLALHRLGVNVGLMAAVGDDLLGRVIIAFLKDRDPRLSRLISVQPGQVSSYSVVLSPQNADRTFLHCTGTNATFGFELIDFAHVEQCKVFHLGYPPFLPRLMANDGAELQAIYRQARATGAVTSLDMALPDPNGPSGQANWPAILQNALPYVDVFLPSIEELLFMARRADYEAWRGNALAHLTRAYLFSLAGEFLQMGVAVVGFKLGEMGFYLRTAEAARFQSFARLALDPGRWAQVEHWSAAFQVNVAGTTGAGDSACAGFLAALLRGLTPHECVTWACAVSACNVEAVDSTSGVRTWTETQARLEAGWPKRPECVPDYPG
jgi:sugar/nucleoside kinase (ribokinase family)